MRQTSLDQATCHAGESRRLALPDEDWALYRGVIEECNRRGLRFAVGGGLAFSCYSGQWRWTKDLDLFISEARRDEVIAVATRAGFTDYYGQKPYDRSWIHRMIRGGAILDLIWEMANHRAKVDERWLSGGREIALGTQTLRAIPVEELIWAKIYILQRDRCDWPDVINLIHAQGGALDWQHLLDRMGDDTPLLRGALSVYAWLCPRRAARTIPPWVWRRLGLPLPVRASEDGPDCEMSKARLDLIDSRDWFGPDAKGVAMAE